MSNIFSFCGTCGKDAEVRYTPSGQAVLSVNVANNIGFGDKQKTIWVRVVMWGKRAEGTLKDYLLKGQQVFVSGELTVNEYDKNDGTRGYQIEVNANVLDLVGKKNENSQAPAPAAQNRQPPPPANQGYQPAPPQQSGAAYQAAQNGTYTPQPQAYPPQPAPSVSNHEPTFDAPYDDDIPF